VIYAALFYFIAGLTVISAIGVALSNNVFYSAMALMGALLGAAGLYVFLAADFVAVVQVLVYVGGILVLTLFAIMLTHQIAEVQVSNRSVGRLPAFVLVLAVGIGMGIALFRAPWHVEPLGEATATTYGIGDSFLNQYLLPFELASVVLLTALVGAIVLSRKELRG
jgi:NADH:ubiquinone oxidoreductase subunit 6 (subunit J)